MTCLVVAGGVAANKKVRSALNNIADKYDLPFLVPPAKFCSDNGLMVAWTGVERLKLGLCRPPPPSLAQVCIHIEYALLFDVLHKDYMYVCMKFACTSMCVIIWFCRPPQSPQVYTNIKYFTSFDTC